MVYRNFEQIAVFALKKEEKGALSDACIKDIVGEQIA